jgi:hydroxymethylbilane synthase
MAERGVLEAVGGDCRTPLGAHAERTAGSMRLRAFVARPDGSGLRAADKTFAWPATEVDAHSLGLELGRSLTS